MPPFGEWLLTVWDPCEDEGTHCLFLESDMECASAPASQLFQAKVVAPPQCRAGASPPESELRPYPRMLKSESVERSS